MTLDDVGDNASPNFIIKSTDGNDKFTVTGATGNTTIVGTTTLSNTLNIKQGVANGIVFNSDRTNQDDVDAALILVKDDSDDNEHGVLSWIDASGSFSFSGSKLNSVLDLTVGTLATPSTTISAGTGAITNVGTAPVITLKNTTGGFAEGASPTIINFQDDSGADLALSLIHISEPTRPY